MIVVMATHDGNNDDGPGARSLDELIWSSSVRS